MATLIQFGTSGGERRRCDATCHNAKEPECVCICAGRYHGKGRTPGGLEKVQKEVAAGLGLPMFPYPEEVKDATRTE